MNIDKFKTLENKLSAAYKNNNLLFIANINTADDYELLTNLQKEDMIIIAEKYQYDIIGNNSDYLQKARKYGHFTGYKN